MTTPQPFDAIVVGSGQAANPLSIALAKAGMHTALIERKHVGGTCINEGCTPTKTMVASGRVAYLARRGADYGVQTGPIRIDLAKVRQRKRDIGILEVVHVTPVAGSRAVLGQFLQQVTDGGPPPGPGFACNRGL